MGHAAFDTTSSRVRLTQRESAGPVELVTVTALAIGVWRLTLGWDWSPITTVDGSRQTAPQSDIDWLIFAIVVLSAIGWLALRGRAIAGTFAVCVPIVGLSGWRMAASDVLAWPISLASLIFSLSVIALISGGLGGWMRHTRTARETL